MSVAKQIIILVTLVLLAGGGYLGWQQYSAEASTGTAGARQSRGAPAVVTAAVVISKLDSSFEAVGSTRARRAVEITPLAAGRVTEINFRAGQSVKAGDVLMRIDDEIQQADLNEADAQLMEARAAMKRATSLTRGNAVAASSVDTLAANVITAESNQQRAARRLRDRTVTAPFNGVVGFSLVDLGSRVKEGDPVTTIDDLSLVEIEFSAPESLFGRIAPGQAVSATAAAFPGREFSGKINAIDSRIDAVSRAFRSRALVANPDLELPAGMFMHVTVLLETRQALTVPETAITVGGEETFVYVVSTGVRGDQADRRNVVLGQRGYGYVEILSGLNAGDEVIIRGLQRVRDGVPVTRAAEPGQQATGSGSDS